MMQGLVSTQPATAEAFRYGPEVVCVLLYLAQASSGSS